jgi:pimeloyl-ACP methyl ester carboxylesterase
MPDEIVRLPDGRRMGVATHGDPDGRVVVLNHGTPASRLGHEFTDAPARARGLRVVCPDRPGIGRSDPRPLRTLAGWADDVIALADVLGVDRFAVLGYSGGGPYALAAAAGAPDRVTAVGLMAGAGPLDRPGALQGMGKTDLQLLDLVQKRPWAARALLRVLHTGARVSPSFALRSFKREVSPVDQRVLDEQGPAIMAFFVEAFRQGPQGVVDDYLLSARPWGFVLEEVRVPVQVWQGDDDLMVPMHQAEDMAARLPNATLHRLPGVGHVSIQLHIGEILDALV